MVALSAPIVSQINSLQYHPNTITSNYRNTPHYLNLKQRQKRRILLIVQASSSSGSVVDGGDSLGILERCFASPSTVGTSGGDGVMYAPVVEMKGGGGGGKFGSVGTVTLEKKKLELSSQQKLRTSPEIATGGGGGDIGKIIRNGGGDGGDDGGDDDDYFGDFDDFEEGDEGGFFRRRLIFQELFDRKFVDAILNEWQKTMMDLPDGLRQAYEMGLVSSAQMVRFLAINARPTVARFVSRSLPEGISRAFIGRMIADPAFLYKFALEQAVTVGSSVWWELKTRKERIRQEWDLALINVLTVSACNAFVVWSLAPCRSYGNTFQFDLQNSVQKLPNNIFEGNYPQRIFDMKKRFISFWVKAAQFAFVGSTAGAAQGVVTNYLAQKKDGRLSVTIPSLKNNALGYGAFLGLYANLRYQILCGVDRAMIHHFDVIGVALLFSAALRVFNVQVGETSRLAWLGVEADPLVQSENMMKAYNKQSETVSSQHSSNWLISKKAVVSGLGLLGIKQQSTDQEDGAPPKARRKRVVRKKVSA